MEYGRNKIMANFQDLCQEIIEVTGSDSDDVDLRIDLVLDHVFDRH